MTGDAERDYFVDGVVEEITTTISRLPWLFVIARNSSFTYSGAPYGDDNDARRVEIFDEIQIKLRGVLQQRRTFCKD